MAHTHSLLSRIRRHRHTNGQPRRRLIKPPKPVQPRSIERWYVKQLHHMQALLQAQVNEKLLPKLAHYRAQAPNHFAGVRNDDLLEDVYGATEQIRVFYEATVTDRMLSDIIRHAAGQTNVLNRSNLLNQLRRVIGVDIFLGDENLENITSTFITHNVQLIRSVETRYFNDLNQTLYNGFSEGLRWEEIAETIQDRYGVSEWNAERVARDQINKLNGQLTEERQTELGVTQYVWRTSLDDRVRATHEAHEGQTFEWEDAPASTGHPGEDILCFLPGTFIDFASVTHAAFRRKYRGEIISLSTETGGELLGTPNHPVLTDSGWKSLQDVQVGDQMFECASSNFLDAASAKVDHFVSTAEQVFDFLSVIQSPERVAASEKQFHGDVTDENVDVIRADHRLCNSTKSVFYNDLEQLFLKLPDVCSRTLFGAGNFHKHAIGAFYPPASIVGGADLTGPLGIAHARPLDLFSFRLGPDFNSRLEQASADCKPIDAQIIRNGVLALSALVISRNLANTELFFIPGNLTLLKTIRVNDHKKSSYEGSVYNFETKTGVYLANNLLVSNCRCWAEPVLDDLI